MTSIVLIGPMGSGKSSVGKRLARDLNRPFVDLDASVERLAGTSIPDFFASQGEAAFRKLETQALREALENEAVIATGGGVVTQAENRELLRSRHDVWHDVWVVYLRATPQTLARRIRRQPGTRPLIDAGKPLDFAQTRRRVEQILSERAPLYEECASFGVDTDNRALGGIVRLIVEAWHRR